MDPQQFLEVATVVTKLKMYPYFDIANYILMSLMVREDNHPPATVHKKSEEEEEDEKDKKDEGAVLFSRKHPLSCWVATMLLCFAGSILGNLLVGEPLLTPFKNHQDILTATAVWYLVNYSPFDLVYKIVKFLPIKLVIYCLKEVQRTNKVHHGVLYAMKLYPGSYFIIALIGVVKGGASSIIRPIARLLCGIWRPIETEILRPSFVTKGSLAAAIIFIVERKGLIQAPHAMIYFGVVIFFVYFRLSSILLGIHDPFVPFENLFCAIFMGGMWDALKRALRREKVDEHTSDVRNDVGKSKDDKKRD